MTENNDLISYAAWERSMRIFHWLNAVCVIGLMVVGTIILNYKLLGIDTDGKILLKTIHVYIGYVFVINLMWRLVAGILGYIRSRHSRPYLERNPLVRLMVGLLFLLLGTQAITGLTLAGTDVYMPPFGNQVIEYIAAFDENQNRLGEIRPGYNNNINMQAYNQMRDFRNPVITVHYYVFFMLLGAIFLHLSGVIFTELRDKRGIVSSMITGKNYQQIKVKRRIRRRII